MTCEEEYLNPGKFIIKLVWLKFFF
jgi:hypothetical protein